MTVRNRVAIIGAGIAGNSAAWELAADYDVTVFEAEARLGGHTRTSTFEFDGREYAVDTGFIVYNRDTYPDFCRLLGELNVPTQDSDMSFGAMDQASGVAYSTRSLSSLFAQRRNLLRPSYYRVWTDFIRLSRVAPKLERSLAPTVTVGEYLDEHGYSIQFRDLFVIPMAAAIWSATPGAITSFPMLTMVRFMQNHRMLQPSGQPMWRVIKGGSRTYVDALYRSLPVTVRRAAPVRSVVRAKGGVTVIEQSGASQFFDAVVIATHSTQALSLLDNPTKHEHQVLGAIRYQPNTAILHTDTAVLPDNRRAWASWNYRVSKGGSQPVCVTYDMNRLQSIESPHHFLVTLNGSDLVEPGRILEVVDYEHPVFDVAAINAQSQWQQISGVRNIFFAGAYWRYGFHEDGVFSGLRAARQLRQTLGTRALDRVANA